MMLISLADGLVLAALAVAGYSGLVWWTNDYSRRANWLAPDGTQDMDWSARRNLGVAMGGLASAVCALACAFWIDNWPARALIVAQAVVMAASGASDLRRFHLPLPLTLAGIALALAGALVGHVPFLFVLFAVAWAVAVIVLHALVSRGSMQLGDHLATVWIAIASPFNGLLAIAAGDAANVFLARVKGLRGRKVAAAGAWLVFAAALVGMPPYFAWFAAAASSKAADAPPAAERAEAMPAKLFNADALLPARQTVTATVLIVLTEWAGDFTARVALADQRSGRIAAAQRESDDVARLAAVARRIAPDSVVGRALDDLAAALDVYDVDGVRDASLRLAEAREQAQQPAPAPGETPPADASTANEEQ